MQKLSFFKKSDVSLRHTTLNLNIFYLTTNYARVNGTVTSVVPTFETIISNVCSI